MNNVFRIIFVLLGLAGSYAMGAAYPPDMDFPGMLTEDPALIPSQFVAPFHNQRVVQDGLEQAQHTEGCCSCIVEYIRRLFRRERELIPEIE